MRSPSWLQTFSAHLRNNFISHYAFPYALLTSDADSLPNSFMNYDLVTTT